MNEWLCHGSYLEIHLMGPQLSDEPRLQTSVPVPPATAGWDPPAHPKNPKNPARGLVNPGFPFVKQTRVNHLRGASLRTDQELPGPSPFP